MFLLLETSTAVCSVALANKGQICALRENREGMSHAASVACFIDEVMHESGASFEQLSAIVVSKGPGSYTGLRIGASTAKGLCFALQKPLIAVSSLQALARAVQDNYPPNALFCPMIDARRMEVYAAIYNAKNQVVREVQADILTEDSFDAYRQQEFVVLGDGAEKCLSLWPNSSILWDHTLCSARHLLPLAEEAFAKKNFVDVAYFEPFYLKNFIAGRPSVKGLR